MFEVRLNWNSVTVDPHQPLEGQKSPNIRKYCRIPPERLNWPFPVSFRWVWKVFFTFLNVLWSPKHTQTHTLLRFRTTAGPRADPNANANANVTRAAAAAQKDQVSENDAKWEEITWKIQESWNSSCFQPGCVCAYLTASGHLLRWGCCCVSMVMTICCNKQSCWLQQFPFDFFVLVNKASTDSKKWAFMHKNNHVNDHTPDARLTLALFVF